MQRFGEFGVVAAGCGLEEVCCNDEQCGVAGRTVQDREFGADAGGGLWGEEGVGIQQSWVVAPRRQPEPFEIQQRRPTHGQVGEVAVAVSRSPVDLGPAEGPRTPSTSPSWKRRWAPNMSAATTMAMDTADCPGKVSSSLSPRSYTPCDAAG